MCPTFHAKSLEPLLGNFDGFSQILVDFQSISSCFLSFSISFSQLQSILGEGKWGCKKCRRIPKREGDWEGPLPKCSLRVPSPEKLFKTRDLELPIFQGSLPSCSPTYFPVANQFFNQVESVKKHRNLSRQGKTTCIGNTKKRVFLEGGFDKSVHLSWLWRSECHMYCWAQCPWVVFVSLGVTTGLCRNPFAKTPF